MAPTTNGRGGKAAASSTARCRANRPVNSSAHQVARNLLSQHTQGLEVYYNIAVTRSIALTLDFQWADSAFKDVDSATVLAARLNIDF
jgi:hypothetical protein